MYLAIPPQHNCPLTWLAAVDGVDAQPGHEAHNVIMSIENPVADTDISNPIVAAVDAFLQGRAQPLQTVSNTIFPYNLYRRRGAPDFFDVFHTRILPKVRKNQRWSGYYFERMTDYPTRSGGRFNPLWDIVERIRGFDQHPSYNKYELTVFDPERDIDRSPYGGQCLSFLSFKLIPGSEKRVTLTAVYRNHYYVEKLLGNLIGLGRLLEFVSVESGVALGPLTVVSTHAQIDQPGRARRSDIFSLVDACKAG